MSLLEEFGHQLQRLKLEIISPSLLDLSTFFQWMFSAIEQSTLEDDEDEQFYKM